MFIVGFNTDSITDVTTEFNNASTKLGLDLSVKYMQFDAVSKMKPLSKYLAEKLPEDTNVQDI